MKNILRKNLGVAWILALMFTWGASPSHAYQQELKKMAADLAARIHAVGNKRVTVVDFVDLDKKPNKLGQFLSQQLQSSLADPEHRLVVVDQGHVSQLFDQIEKLNEGLLDPETGQQLGKIAGTEVIVVGTAMPSSLTIRLDVKAIDLQTAKIITGSSAKLTRIGLLERLATESMAEGSREATGGADSGRTVQAVTRPPAATPRRPARTLRDQDVMFELDGCSLNGNSLTCAVTITSERRDRGLVIHFDSRAWNDVGDEFGPGDIKIANSRSSERCAWKTVLEGVPTAVTLTFPSFGDESSIVERLRLSWKEDDDCRQSGLRYLDFEKIALSDTDFSSPRATDRSNGRRDSGEKAKGRGGILKRLGDKVIDAIEDSASKVIDEKTRELVGDDAEEEEERP